MWCSGNSTPPSVTENSSRSSFNATFRDGEFITLLGPSGCGKTTMLRIIAGFEKPTRGEVYIDGTLVSGGKTFVPPEKRGIGMVFQSYAVWPHMNVFDNVAYPLTIRHVSKAEIKTSVERVLGIVHLSQYAERFPNQLSGGQQQRVALARALVAEPKLLLLDEPLSNLDAKLRESMRFEIKEIQRKLGITVVYVTHDQTEAMAMSDRIFLINRGDIQQCGTPQEIYNSPVRQRTAESSSLPWMARAFPMTVHGRERSMSRSGRKTCSLQKTASCTGFWRPSIISEMWMTAVCGWVKPWSVSSRTAMSIRISKKVSLSVSVCVILWFSKMTGFWNRCWKSIPDPL